MPAYDRKLVQIGNSVGVTLPPDVLTVLELEAGDWLQLEVVDADTPPVRLECPTLMITKSDLRVRTQEHQDEIRRHRAALARKK